MPATTATPDAPPQASGAPIASRPATASTTTSGDESRILAADNLAYRLLHAAYVLVPLVMGIDKFAHVLTDDWTRYLAPWMNSIIPGTAGQAMHMVGIVEIIAAVLVAVKPKFGAPVVAGWLAGIVVSLLSVGGYGDIVVRDLALLGAAVVLTVMAWARG